MANTAAGADSDQGCTHSSRGIPIAVAVLAGCAAAWMAWMPLVLGLGTPMRPYQVEYLHRHLGVLWLLGIGVGVVVGIVTYRRNPRVIGVKRTRHRFAAAATLLYVSLLLGGGLGSQAYKTSSEGHTAIAVGFGLTAASSIVALWMLAILSQSASDSSEGGPAS